MNADEYIKLYREIKLGVIDIGVTEPELNTQVSIAILQEIGKDNRVKATGKEHEKKEEPATEKQIKFLRDLGISFKEGITKKEASALIDREIKGWQK